MQQQTNWDFFWSFQCIIALKTLGKYWKLICSLGISSHEKVFIYLLSPHWDQIKLVELLKVSLRICQSTICQSSVLIKELKSLSCCKLSGRCQCTSMSNWYSGSGWCSLFPPEILRWKTIGSQWKHHAKFSLFCRILQGWSWCLVLIVLPGNLSYVVCHCSLSGYGTKVPTAQLPDQVPVVTFLIHLTLLNCVRYSELGRRRRL